MQIDIMMPFYGDVELFERAVESVRAQTDDGWRLVIVDDCYPDARPEKFVAELGDSRITYVRNTANMGLSANFQRCIDLAEADFMTIMGCDDVLLPEYVQRMRRLIEMHPTATYLQPGVAVIDGRGTRVRPVGDRVKAALRPHAGEHSGEDLATSLLGGNWTYFPSICWQRAALVRYGFRVEFAIVLDLALQLDIVMGGGLLVVDDDVLFEYRRHALSASSWAGSGPQRFREESALFAEAAQRARRLRWKHARRAAQLHWSSRLNALTQAPLAVRAWDRAGIGAILGHVLSLPRRAPNS